MTGGGTLVRRARPGDLGELVGLWREMWDHHVPLDPRFEPTAAADFVMERWIEGHLHSDRSAVFAAEEPGGGLSGYVLGTILDNPPVVRWPSYGHVSELAVRRRRQGIGTLLLEAMHGWFRERGLPYVEVNVSALNPGARAFWRKRGYGEFIERLRVEL
jgi:ribosomal protein S18 acetylase RimI-like enzyme